MTSPPDVGRLDRPVDPASDHVLGPLSAPITLVEYGSYDCPHCRAANERISEVRDRFGDRVRYVFRHLPIKDSRIAWRAAVLAERAPDEESFWHAHLTLMTRSPSLTEDDLRAVGEELSIAVAEADDVAGHDVPAEERVRADVASARASGVMFTPTFFINGRRYDGPWDESSFIDAMEGTLGHRVRAAALGFAAWGPSAGLLLLGAVLVAIALTNVGFAEAYEAFWEMALGASLGGAAFSLSLRHWVNDGLLTIFFLVVGLEIKREFTVGRLAQRSSAAFPVAAALGGMAVPALLYVLLIPDGPWIHGWGIPMATDTAFAIALIVMMGSRVPIELRIFLTAAAIVDDIGAIVVVAVAYSEELQLGFVAGAMATVVVLALLNRWRVYRVAPYALVGLLLWALVLGSGLHATLAGVLLALFIPTRPPADLRALTTQASALIAAEARRGGEVLHHGPSVPALRALDAIHDRLESPADRLLRHAGARSSYIVLPLFALANAGVVLETEVLSSHWALMLAIGAGLVIGKPIGLLGASFLAVRMGLATKPEEYSWRQLAGAGALAGIGFTMSVFIAGQALPTTQDFEAAKVAILGASVVAATLGALILWLPGRAGETSGLPYGETGEADRSPAS
ncbi:Na+/H+ antiporter NhaA [Lutibaculum baratangense]|uniref:Na(+)/H(+) antiporter NhaA n=1 Tax=Lutibaculum baratangense AMV1 TaxID=631454 RepID=V4RC27_9HYPH|nr:Na+/H+ antiporter NhaA [Lutibaculum baratangense]ESR23721.1 Na+/H+ antiporter NhaA type [Lutibaculum baratangense AMV1]